ncbi:hypothetical protein J2T57_001627 [Natronocella acetinitrilica]|uniref:Uncharacterized protein n=1 Tax=Natronocella acetinitrilica TaxID=414046 RepID=A0AAE3KAM5_9GAMM|nr:hypothetical protein [Natronocella acetinitrilica]MCP1674525.1 hypothetical protein [Natronocella acetinitrilica]
MATLPSNAFVAVPIRLDLYQELMRRHGQAANAVVEDQVEAFLERTEGDPVVSPAAEGVTWDGLFLPEKTRLRTRHRRVYKYADVVSDHIVYEGERYSTVNRAVNAMRNNTQNNAWRFTEVLRPSDAGWTPAERLRRR